MECGEWSVKSGEWSFLLFLLRKNCSCNQLSCESSLLRGVLSHSLQYYLYNLKLSFMHIRQYSVTSLFKKREAKPIRPGFHVIKQAIEVINIFNLAK